MFAYSPETTLDYILDPDMTKICIVLIVLLVLAILIINNVCICIL